MLTEYVESGSDEIPDSVLVALKQLHQELLEVNSHVDLLNFVVYVRNFMLNEPAKNTSLREFMAESKRKNYYPEPHTFVVIFFIGERSLMMKLA